MPPNQCENCCACCYFCGEPPFATQAELDNLPALLLNPLLEHYDNTIASGLSSRGLQQLPCLWLSIESGICQHYDYRPQICSSFEVYSTDCQLFVNKVYGCGTIFTSGNLYIEGLS